MCRAGMGVAGQVSRMSGSDMVRSRDNPTDMRGAIWITAGWSYSTELPPDQGFLELATGPLATGWAGCLGGDRLASGADAFVQM
jgi:hypothetical protein